MSCTSATACTAVGTSQSGAGAQLPLAESWDGTSWVLDTVATPAGATSSGLQGVSCVASGWCDAVGSYDTASADGLVLAETTTLP